VEEIRMADLGEIPEIPVEIEEKGPSKGRKILTIVLTLFIGIAAGGAGLYFLGPKLGLTAPPGGKVQPPVIGDDAKTREIENLRHQLDAYSVLGNTEKIRADMEELTKRRQAQGTMEEIETKLRDALDKEESYDALTRDLENLNERIATAQGTLEGMNRQVAEAESRLQGLRTAIARLEEQVGQLDVADARRQAVKAALLRDVEQLIIQVRKSMPLAPPEYAKDARIARAERLKEELENSNWVRPELLEQYTQLYLEEIRMATQENYFIASIPLEENGKPVMKWAECVSIGNRMTYFETLDRKFTGVCRNTNPQGVIPRYQLLVDLPRGDLMEIREIMAQYRPQDYEQRIRTQLGEEVELVGTRPTVAEQPRAS
jgi:uncharacterized coiled-coil protein SlyX